MIKPTSLRALSEASCVFDAGLITPLLEELADKALPVEKDPRLKDIEQTIVAVDGTLLPALPRMLWALWINDDNRAAKLHLEMDIDKYVPTGAVITHGSGNETTVLRKNFIGTDKVFLLDSGYAQYNLLAEIASADSSFVIRLKDNAVWDTLEEKPLSKEDKEAGVTRDMVVNLGSKGKKDDYPSPLFFP